MLTSKLGPCVSPKAFSIPTSREQVCIEEHTNVKHYASTRLQNEMPYTKLGKFDTMGL